jgi:hypothetical protein
MELIERYLQAVKFALPSVQQDDIVKELRDNILSQVEEQEQALGRSLNEDEQVELLKKLGSPMHLASRYRKQQYVISATLFPIYWRVLKAALGLAFMVLAVASIATAAAAKPVAESLGVLLRYPSVALTTFAWVTLVFFALEFFGTKIRFNDGWDPRKLPPLAKTNPRKSRIELIAQLVIQIIFAVWWLTGLHYQYLIFGPGMAFLNFGPIWLTLFPVFVVTCLTDITFTLAKILRPHWTDARPLQQLAMSTLGLVIVFALLRSPDLLVPAPGAETQFVGSTANTALHVGLLVAAIVNVLNVAIGVVRFIGMKLGRAHQAAVGS